VSTEGGQKTDWGGKKETKKAPTETTDSGRKGLKDAQGVKPQEKLEKRLLQGRTANLEREKNSELFRPSTEFQVACI